MTNGYSEYAIRRMNGGFAEMTSFNLVLPYLSNKFILDIGCSNGLYLKYFKQAVGIEQIEVLANEAEIYGHRIINSDLLHGLSLLADISFEGVFFSHVMEHVDSPIICLREINRVLIPGGCLVLGLPTERNFFRDIMRMDYFNGTHLYSFSIKNAIKLLKETNFKVVKIYFHLPFFKGKTGVFVNKIWNYVYFPNKIYFSMAYWIVAEKEE